MAFVYILFSEKINTFYVGSCVDLLQRLEQHRNGTFGESFTSKTNDWEIFFSIDNLEYDHARAIEKYIKSMKSRVYIYNLKKYPEISVKLVQKFKSN